MRESTSEFFERVNKIEDELTRARELWANDNQRVREFLRVALDPNIIWLLPDGNPPYTPNNEVNTHTNMWAEVRRLYLFIKGGNDNLPDIKRQTSFIQTLEYVHPRDAELLLAIKNHQWPFDNITAEMVNKIWPGTIQKKEENQEES